MVEIYSFGAWVRRRRKALDLTQEHLASRVGCSKVLISKIETDERRPSREIAALLAVALELDPDDQPAFVQAARAELAADRLPPPTTRMPHMALAASVAAPAPQAQPSPEPPLTLVAQSAEPDPSPVARPTSTASRRSQAGSGMRGFWAWWATASAVGWGMGRVLGWYIGSRAYGDQMIDLGGGSHLFGAGLALTLDTIIAGIPNAVLQTYILRHRLANARWWGITTLLAWILVGVPSRLLSIGVGSALTGAAIGIAQWLVLRRSARAGWWIPVSICGWAPLWIASSALNVVIYHAIGGTMSDIVYERGAGWAIALLLSGALVGGALGVCMGGALAWIVGPPTAPPAPPTVEHISPPGESSGQ